jgi:peroxiredoxin
VRKNQQLRRRVGATFPFLSDPSQKVAKQYTGSQEGGMDKPSVFLINREGRVAWDYRGGVADRPAASEVLKQLDLAEEAWKKGSPSTDAAAPCPTLGKKEAP